ncbi:hypothetical protein EDB80DRAFT_807733 [Ilyonectria destructans]|nr:hypothetical protein EDB80DRAFT_807733 [Ilyonectria destructans]
MGERATLAQADIQTRVHLNVHTAACLTSAAGHLALFPLLSASHAPTFLGRALSRRRESIDRTQRSSWRLAISSAVSRKPTDGSHWRAQKQAAPSTESTPRLTAASSTATRWLWSEEARTSTRLDSTSLLHHSLRTEVGEDEREMRGSFRVGTVPLASIPNSCHGHREHIPRANANPDTLSLLHTSITSSPTPHRFSTPASRRLDALSFRLPARELQPTHFLFLSAKVSRNQRPSVRSAVPVPLSSSLAPSSARPADRSPTNRPRQGSSAQPAIPPLPLVPPPRSPLTVRRISKKGSSTRAHELELIDRVY